MNRTATILVVDDILANRETIGEILGPLEYRLIEAADGPTALRLAAETSPDLVLLDVMMPGMDGYEVCRRIRADLQLAEVPVIMVTALNDRVSRLAGIGAGADDVISKPLDGAELRARVRTITRLNRYRRLMEAQEELRENEQWLKVIFEHAAVGVVQVDPKTTRFLRFNERFCALLGYSREEMALLTIAEVTHAQDIEQDSDIRARLSNGSIREYTREKRYLRKDGSTVWASVAVSRIGEAGESGSTFIGVVSDIRERKRLEEHVQQAQKMDAIGTLAGGIAHDFNNILASINGAAELAEIKLKENPEVRKHLQGVLQAVKRAADLVRQILTFSRHQPLERTPIKLHAIVAETLKLLRATIPSTIEFDISLAKDAPTVFADVTQIHQALMNLATNACHSMKDGPGRLQVKLERCVVEPEDLELKSPLRPLVYARVSVRDTGCGMDPATLRRIFEPFYTTKPLGEGTGLGLSVVQGIMDTHDGAVTVQSEPGQGTVFHLYFPAHAGEAAKAVAKVGQVPRGHGERIMMVDDEQLLAELGKEILVQLGYEVEVVTHPEAALALVRADPERFGLVITDQTMPGMTGLVLAQELRQIRPELPIILTSGYALTLTSERLAAAGIRHLLLKPTTIHDLGTAVDAAFSARHQPEFAPLLAEGRALRS